MKKPFLSRQDLEQIKKMGLSQDQIFLQLEILRKGSNYCNLIRPATINDGIRRFSRAENETFISTFEKIKENLKLIKFLPASGAATRMFEIPLYFLHHPEKLTSSHRFIEDFIKGIKSKKFAFYHDLRKVMNKNHHSLDTILNQGKIEIALEYLLTPIGLNYSKLPKALIKFHTYGPNTRTPLEEHMAESEEYAKNGKGIIRIHFTISEEFLKEVQNYTKLILHQYENKDRRYLITFSVQKPSTNTIAVDMQNHPLRDHQNKIIFRQGGHGALIENLNKVNEDFIFISNIDNVFPDHLKTIVVYYKKVLAGFLLFIQTRIFGYMDLLSNQNLDLKQLDKIHKFCQEYLNIPFPKGFTSWSSKKRIKYIIEKLNRPIRVCGMVKNEGEPGGGPFWIRDKSNQVSLQIVEKAQIDVTSKEQLAILSASTHFNPVDLVCGIKNFKGKKFDLRDFIDPETYFVSGKSLNGNPIKALELPGLWNGAMAKWNTLFVEVPTATFNPVKTINDLLKPEHQPLDGK